MINFIVATLFVYEHNKAIRPDSRKVTTGKYYIE